MWAAQGEAAVRTVVDTARLTAGAGVFATILGTLSAPQTPSLAEGAKGNLVMRLLERIDFERLMLYYYLVVGVSSRSNAWITAAKWPPSDTSVVLARLEGPT